jgi:hypothetical protein
MNFDRREKTRPWRTVHTADGRFKNLRYKFQKKGGFIMCSCVPARDDL